MGMTGKPARKVFTEAMIRKTLQKHFEIDLFAQQPPATTTVCECGWSSTRKDADKAFEDHVIDQLHKLWHEMFGKPKQQQEVVIP